MDTPGALTRGPFQLSQSRLSSSWCSKERPSYALAHRSHVSSMHPKRITRVPPAKKQAVVRIGVRSLSATLEWLRRSFFRRNVEECYARTQGWACQCLKVKLVWEPDSHLLDYFGILKSVSDPTSVQCQNKRSYREKILERMERGQTNS